jgi:hypothetical protein
MLTDTDEERAELSPEKTQTVSSEKMPEVQQYVSILDQVYQDSFLATIKG